MRILYVSGSMPPMKCGVGDYTSALAEAMAQRDGVEVAVVSAGDAVARPGAGFDLFAAAGRWELARLPGILWVIQSWSPDIVHFQFPSLGYAGILPWILPSLVHATRRIVVQTWHEYLHPRDRFVSLPNAVVPGGLVVCRGGYRERMPAWYSALLAKKVYRFIENASTIPQVAPEHASPDALRKAVGAEGRQIIAYFGFAHAHKGIEELFEIADPERHHLVLACELDPSDAYQKEILSLASSARWAEQCTVTGFLEPAEVARVLAGADAVVFPFRTGSSSANVSIRAALVQGVFVLTTSLDENGYDAERNIAYCRPGDIEGMRRALDFHAGTRLQSPKAPEWDRVVDEHLRLYGDLVGHRVGPSALEARREDVS